LLYDITSKIRRTTNPEKILSIATNELSKAINAQQARIVIDLGQGNPGKKS
jgi:hypothetical protein